MPLQAPFRKASGAIFAEGAGVPADLGAGAGGVGAAAGVGAVAGGVGAVAGGGVGAAAGGVPCADTAVRGAALLAPGCRRASEATKIADEVARSLMVRSPSASKEDRRWVGAPQPFVQPAPWSAVAAGASWRSDAPNYDAAVRVLMGSILCGLLAVGSSCSSAPPPSVAHAESLGIGIPPPPTTPVDARAGSAVAATLGAFEVAEARPWPEMEALFRRDPRWLGGDAILSIPLAPDRTLWLFGDSLVARSAANVRREAVMPHNTVALERGLELQGAEISFHWRRDLLGRPSSFFPDQGTRYFWPGHGLRFENGPLVIFLFGIVSTPGKGLGFDGAGYAIAVIDDPDAPLDEWKPRIADGPALPFDAMPSTAVARSGEHVVALATRQSGTHAGALVRYRVESLAQGDLSGAEWWCGEDRGWVPTGSVGAEGPAFVIDDAGSECSLHWDERVKSWVHVASYGFGATTIGLRTAPAITGPWSAPTTIYRPPESDRPTPFVYAAKAHPEIEGPSPDDLVITYATNSLDFLDLFTVRGANELYWPRVVVVPLRRGERGSEDNDSSGPDSREERHMARICTMKI